ncbi:hypothetical protein BGZ99_009441 [Dissophora globulifera]|uniref:Uncharacterized protein n=1 Tax=Dissophora globulifera TaxID=979702 RepID=A0A9P6RQK7_9FUNG|nr:hypothetical protein BGZ99_009441 [Dissophora globulifera]
MDTSISPPQWDPPTVAAWLRTTCRLAPTTAQAFIDNDVDGSVLLADIDHEALKNEFGITSFGQRCSILKHIRTLRASTTLGDEQPDIGSPQLSTVMALGDLNIGSSSSQSLEHVRPDRRLNRRGSDENNDASPIITLLEQPLQVWRDINIKDPQPWHESEERAPDDISLEGTDGDDEDEDEDEDDSDNSVNAKSGDVLEMGSSRYREDTVDNIPLAVRIKAKQGLARHTAHIDTSTLSAHQSLSTTPRKPMRIAPTLISYSTSPVLPSGGSSINSGNSKVAPTLVSAPLPVAKDLQPAIKPTPGTQSQSVNVARRRSSKIDSAARRADVKQLYFSRVGMNLREIFFNKDGTAFESNSEDEWCQVLPRTSKRSTFPGNRLILQKNMKRILREPPIFDTPGHVVYAPMRRGKKDIPVRVLTTSNLDVTSSTWDTTFKDLQKSASLRVELSNDDMTSIDFRTFTKKFNQDAPISEPADDPAADDPVYPLYGESDASEYTTDEELHKQVAKEERERRQADSGATSRNGRRARTPIHPEQIQEVIDHYQKEYRERWEKQSMPLLEKRRLKTYRRFTAGGRKSKSKALKKIKQSVKSLLEVRLPAIIDAFALTSYNSVGEVRKACKAMDRTLDQLYEQQWRIRLVQGSTPSPPPPPTTTDDLNPVVPSSVDARPDMPELLGKSSALHRQQNPVESDDSESEEEKFQRKLDDDFIDDSELYLDAGDKSDLDADGDSAMHSPPGERSGSSKSRRRTAVRETDISKIRDSVSQSLSLPSPPSTANTPRGEQHTSEAEPLMDEENSHNVHADDDDDQPLIRRRGKHIKHRQLQQPTSSSLMTQDVDESGRSSPGDAVQVSPTPSIIHLDESDSPLPGLEPSRRLHVRSDSLDAPESRPKPTTARSRSSSVKAAKRPGGHDHRRSADNVEAKQYARRKLMRHEQQQKEEKATVDHKKAEDEKVADEKAAVESQSKEKLSGKDEKDESLQEIELDSDNGTSESDSDVEEIEIIAQRPAPIKLMAVPGWRETYKDDELIEREMRLTRKEMALGKDVRHREPYLSIWQEYVEWVELDGDSFDFKDFLKWKDEGNSTRAYRESVRQKAAAQAAADKEMRLREKREKRQARQREAREQKKRARHGVQEKTSLSKEASDGEQTPTQVTREKKEQPVTGTLQIEAAKKDVDQDTETVDRTDTIMIPSDSSEDEELILRRKRPPRITKITSDVSDSDAEDSAYTRKRGSKTNRSRVIEGEEEEETFDINDIDDDPPIQSTSYSSKKRPRRNYFGDSTESDGSFGEEEEEGDHSRSHRKRRVPQVMKAEPEEVLRLRKDASQNELDLQKRIKEQEERAKLRTSINPLQEGEALINPGHKDTERPVAIPAFIAQNLKPHQLDGIRFMWKNVVMFNGGCILAHSMGLGKTFQVIAFIYVLLRELRDGNRDIPDKLQAGRVLLLMPPIVLQNWVDEFKKWIPIAERDVVRVRRLPLVKAGSITGRVKVLEDWYKEGGVFLIGYAMFREMCVSNSRSRGSVAPEVADRLRQLLQQGASVTIADEGHSIKNSEAKLAGAAKGIVSTARVILTGYPLQNRLEEYWCMVDFVRPNFLGDAVTFRHNYIRPIDNGLYPDSSMFEKKASAKKLKVLTELIKNFVMRKDQSVLRATLPKKVEFVIGCALSTMQYYLYTSFLPTLDKTTKAVLGNGHILLTICNHPAAFQAAVLETQRRGKDRSKAIVGRSEDNPTVADALTMTVKEAGTGEDDEDESAEKEVVQVLSQNKKLISSDWTGDLFQQQNVSDVSHSYKAKILMDILHECRAVKEKTLVFTRSIPTLDYIEYIAQQSGFKTMKLDGSTPVVNRQDMINEFNASNKFDAFLISSGAGSQGVNLVTASRVVIYDVGWNPSHDEQAIARAFRYGQTRKVFVYRLQTFGTWEDKLYKTNLHKLGLANRVVDKKNMVKAFTKTEMQAYFEPPPDPELTPEWASQENVEALFTKPDTEDPVLRAVIDKNVKAITSVIPQSELVREEDSDLTEADMVEIQNMIAEEQRRIDGKPPLLASTLIPREAARPEGAGASGVPEARPGPRSGVGLGGAPMAAAISTSVTTSTAATTVATTAAGTSGVLISRNPTLASLGLQAVQEDPQLRWQYENQQRSKMFEESQEAVLQQARIKFLAQKANDEQAATAAAAAGGAASGGARSGEERASGPQTAVTPEVWSTVVPVETTRHPPPAPHWPPRDYLKQRVAPETLARPLVQSQAPLSMYKPSPPQQHAQSFQHHLQQFNVQQQHYRQPEETVSLERLQQQQQQQQAPRQVSFPVSKLERPLGQSLRAISMTTPSALSPVTYPADQSKTSNRVDTTSNTGHTATETWLQQQQEYQHTSTSRENERQETPAEATAALTASAGEEAGEANSQDLKEMTFQKAMAKHFQKYPSNHPQ